MPHGRRPGTLDASAVCHRERQRRSAVLVSGLPQRLSLKRLIQTKFVGERDTQGLLGSTKTIFANRIDGFTAEGAIEQNCVDATGTGQRWHHLLKRKRRHDPMNSHLTKRVN